MKTCVYNSRRCVFCGKPIPGGGRTEKRECRPGLGDYVAQALSAVGITEERVSQALGKPCGCKQRRAAMNAWGEKVLGLGKQK